MHQKTKELLAKVIDIVESYQQAGYRMTLRQLYYQLVAKNIIANKLSEYSKLSVLLTDARMYGLIDWDFIEDRVRVRKMASEFADIPELIDVAISSYRRQRWDDQEYYVEVIVEKNALIGVLDPICRDYHISIFPNVGYGSTTVIHELAERFEQKQDKKCILLYFGDHDPSGEDMVRDIKNRLDIFEVDVEVIKVALTIEQVQQYNLPPNPAKMSDPRASNYVAEHGSNSWELDALPPNVLVDLLTNAIEEYIDMDKYTAVRELEEKEKQQLEDYAENFEVDTS
jgi:hypothetical protein